MEYQSFVGHHHFRDFYTQNFPFLIANVRESQIDYHVSHLIFRCQMSRLAIEQPYHFLIFDTWKRPWWIQNQKRMITNIDPRVVRCRLSCLSESIDEMALLRSCL
eukprot:NODE_233_length_12044_cov_0.738803.p9 type:complete len:105 gc:universal NODE_233_length_12044_cov_0.738803:7058-6744(-)